MTRLREEQNLSPRVSALETNQEALQRDISALTLNVDKLGTTLTNSIMVLSQSQNANYNALSEKIGNANKTDWQSFWTAVGVCLMVLGAILVPVWIAFRYEERLDDLTRERVGNIEFEIKTIREDVASLKTKNEH